MLVLIRDLIQQRGSVSLADIARHLDVTPDTARPMVEVWLRKGTVTKVPLACGSCTHCESADVEIFSWAGGDLVAVGRPRGCAR